MDPFFFLRPREEEPLTLQTAVFTPQEVFTLMDGGFELGMFAAHQMNINMRFYKSHGLGPWREALIERLAPAGLMDRSGEPCPELAEALAPLRSLGSFVGDGDLVDMDTTRDVRSCVVSVDETWSRATAVVRAHGGFRLVPFGPDRSWWPVIFERVFRLEGRYLPSKWSQHEIHGGFKRKDEEFDHALRGGERAARAYCEAHGVDPAPLVDLVLSRRRGFRGPSGISMYAYRIVGCELPKNLPCRMPVPESGKSRSRFSVVYPQKGFVIFFGCSPLPDFPDDWSKHPELRDACRYKGFDFLAADEPLMDNVLGFCDYPEED
ncbi:hypothetical protein Corgl_0021 [Coriobacterium glomerans PW2]|uniref:Uncharacterized protein n=1 Tax=Coriobacterium glomerans (strain ATCC 49209 / DSM 20642 / JCM 10262 / PW2) TaxID=700015 RepID=F2N6V2_CORGP|nr:hypothetical protein [Coriobacterium glomerans]AEB06151.1 hypothetical protein Corgl_0021 [Coriobacterium glomerans PW2]